MGKSAGPCSHVICSGTRLFQGEDRPKKLPGCVVTHRSKQQQALYIQLQTFFFFIGQSVENSQFHSSNGSLAGPTHSLRKPLWSLHLPFSVFAFGDMCACNFPKYCYPSEFKDNVGHGSRHLGVG